METVRTMTVLGQLIYWSSPFFILFLICIRFNGWKFSVAVFGGTLALVALMVGYCWLGLFIFGGKIL